MSKWAIVLFLFSTQLYAQPPIILKAEAIAKTNQLFDIAVTLRHPDTGWDHFANEWVVIVNGDKQIAKRKLHHPHVNEQPFKRYVRDVKIPDDAQTVEIYAQCNKRHKSTAYVILSKKTLAKDPE